ncbi:MAG: hypothetical protein WCJ60_04165 [bacterium]
MKTEQRKRAVTSYGKRAAQVFVQNVQSTKTDSYKKTLTNNHVRVAHYDSLASLGPAMLPGRFHRRLLLM